MSEEFSEFVGFVNNYINMSVDDLEPDDIYFAAKSKEENSPSQRGQSRFTIYDRNREKVFSFCWEISTGNKIVIPSAQFWIYCHKSGENRSGSTILKVDAATKNLSAVMLNTFFGKSSKTAFEEACKAMAEGLISDARKMKV